MTVTLCSLGAVMFIIYCLFDVPVDLSSSMVKPGREKGTERVWSSLTPVG